jgi:hypothetical protein
MKVRRKEEGRGQKNGWKKGRKAGCMRMNR